MKPPTPMPGARPPVTDTLNGRSAEYTSSQIWPTPMEAVCAAALYTVPVNCVMTMSTPGVEEKFGFVACPPLLIWREDKIHQRLLGNTEGWERTVKGTWAGPTIFN